MKKAIDIARSYGDFCGRALIVPVVKYKNGRAKYKEVTFYRDWLLYGVKTPEMITLRELARRDRAVASITSNECHFIAEMLTWAASITHRWPFKYLMPVKLRQKELSMRMLAATLGRTPEEAKALTTQIKEAMEADGK